VSKENVAGRCGIAWRPRVVRLESSRLLLRELGIYGGAQGIWVDKEHTQALTPERTGVTVGLLHTGSSYPDDLAEDGVFYHYPLTNRPPARDRAEVERRRQPEHYNFRFS
jgi:hypothetical protein